MNTNEARSHGFNDAIDGGTRYQLVPAHLMPDYELGHTNGTLEREWLDNEEQHNSIED